MTLDLLVAECAAVLFAAFALGRRVGDYYNPARDRDIVALLQTLTQKVDRIMSGLDDLKAADAALVTAVNGTVTYLQGLAATLTDPDADVELVAQDVAAQAARLAAAIAPPAGAAPSSTANSPVAPSPDVVSAAGAAPSGS